VKDNIGHTESASGAAGLVKTVLMMQKRVIPKQANFSVLNPKIPPLEPDQMVIPKRTLPWTSPKLTAVVNNYGAAGSNAAIVVQEYQSPKVALLNGISSHIDTQEVPFYLSAKSPESFRAYCTKLKSFLPKLQESHGMDALSSLAYNLAVKQNRTLEYSCTFTATGFNSLEKNLDLASQSSSKLLRKVPTKALPVVLCFGGQNGRTVGLDESLYHGNRLLQTHLVSFKTS
jgi:acyl transferase domain-containing protein